MSRTVRASARALALAFAAATVSATIAVRPAAAQGGLLEVGAAAPDFTLTTVTADGATAAPFILSEHRGETVVLAFFPKARTSGCTAQMETYRDRFADIFNGGEKVQLIGISIDDAEALTSWAKDAGFPFLMGADTDRAVGQAYGASAGSGYHRRYLYVIGPDGTITYATNFRAMAQDAYDALEQAVDAAAR